MGLVTVSTPNTPARSRLSPDERRAQLLDLGVRLLAARSIDELSIDLLAEEAGISRGLLYHYFGNKHAFHEAVVRRACDDLIAQTAPPVDGDTLEIDHAQWKWDNFIDVFTSFRGSAKADVSVWVPRDIALKLGVVTATALVSGLTTDATISSVGGELVVDGVSGDVQLNSVGGEVTARNHFGKIAARTVSGDITATGEIVKFSGDTVSGDVFLDIVGLPDEVRANTVSGSVTTRLEDGVPVQYRINTVSGRLQLDDSEIRGVHGGYTGKYGSLDRRWLEFRANTVSGNISVLHQVSA